MDAHFIIALFHVLVVVPFLGYVFINRAATPEYVYNILFFVGIFVLVYHAYKAVLRLRNGSSLVWISLIHVLAIAPIMIYVGYMSKKTPRPAYEILGLITFAALGYHLYSLVLMTQLVKDDD
jgi:hypothetical protein